ncbi:MAG: RodZ domain-containing protein [Azonexus sp.]
MTESVSPDRQPDQPAEVVSGPLPDVGARLRLAREMRSLSVSDIAQTLKLGTRQVEALERGHWHGLPGQTFIRGFVRNYARVLQIDPAPLMELLDAALEKPADSLNVSDTRMATMPSSQPRRDRTVVFAGLLLVVLAGLAYVLLPNDLQALREKAQGLIDSLSRQEAATAPLVASAPPAAPAEPVFPPGATQEQVMNPQAQAVSELAPAKLDAPAVVPPGVPPGITPAVPSASEKPTPAEKTAVADAAQLRFVFAKESWVEVRDRDNKVIFSQRGAAGSEEGVNGQGPLSLVIGYAPGVKLFWRGQAIDLAPHTKGQIARLVLE